jgi:hypothetical protein
MMRVVVFADEYCNQEIKIFALNGQISDAAHDFEDGLNWWSSILDRIESDFGSKWCHVFMTSADGSAARMFSRRLKDSGGTDFLPAIEPMLIGFSRDTLEQWSILYGNDRYQEFDLNNFDFNSCYLDGCPESIIDTLCSVFKSDKRRFLNAFILEKPSQSDLDAIRNSSNMTLIYLESTEHFIQLKLLESQLSKIANLIWDLTEMGEQFNLSGLEGRSQLLSLEELLRSESKRLFIQFEMDFIRGLK